MTGPPLLDVRDLTVAFQSRRRKGADVVAVDSVSFSVAPGETLGLVGESGAGKSTVGRSVLGLVDVSDGSIRLDGEDITHAGPRERRRLAKQIAAVFQDPYGSLNPDRRIGYSLQEPLAVHGHADRAARRRAVSEMLARVSLPADAANRYPSEFSGGQRQRIAIARALMHSPRLVICDEPVSALDLSVQAQILNLLLELQAEQNLGYLFVSHDLAVVRHVSHRIVVLYRGRVMESGPAEAVYRTPVHPYTRTLIAAELTPDPDEQRRRRAARVAARVPVRAETLRGQTGCPFADRCPYVLPICREQRPALRQRSLGALVACHRADELETAGTVGTNAARAGGA